MHSTRTTLRRALATAAFVPVLTLSTVACSGDGGNGGDEGGNGQQTGAPRQADGGRDEDGGEEGDVAAREGEVPPLTEAQLKRALIRTGDVQGYKAQHNEQDPLPVKNTIDADRPECEAITDAVDSRPVHARTAYTGGVLMKGDFSTGGTIQQVLLSAYEEGEAATWMKELATSLEECDSFTGTVGTGEQARLDIDPGDSIGIGNDSVQFTMKDAKGKDSPTLFTIVRAGNNTATFMSIGLSGDPEPVAKSVVAKQHEKLMAAGGGGR